MGILVCALTPWAHRGPWAHGPLEPMGPMGAVGLLGHMGPLGRMGPIGPMGPFGPKVSWILHNGIGTNSLQSDKREPPICLNDLLVS